MPSLVFVIYAFPGATGKAMLEALLY